MQPSRNASKIKTVLETVVSGRKNLGLAVGRQPARIRRHGSGGEVCHEDK